MVPMESKGLARRLCTFMTFIMSSLIGLLLVEDVDAVWVANPDIFGLIPGLLFRWRFRCPLVFNVDDLSIEDVSNLEIMGGESMLFRLARAVSRFLYQRVDAVTPLSPGYYDGIARFGVPHEDIHLVPVGVDLDIFKPAEKRQDGFTVAYSGSFSVAYDFDQILKAAETLREHHEIRFIIQGKGELGQGIRKSINEMGLENVELIDAIYTRGQVAEFLGQADALILPLIDFGAPYPGISSKLYEYQALSKPIICCAEGQPSVYVEETSSGIVVKPGDYNGLADAVIYLQMNGDEADAMGRAGRRYVETNVGVDKIGQRLKAVLTKAIQRRRET